MRYLITNPESDSWVKIQFLGGDTLVTNTHCGQADAFFTGIDWGFGSYSSYTGVDLLDDKHNPLFWRTWFREFLLEHIPQRVKKLMVASGVLPAVARCARARPLQQREWVFKNWKQGLFK